MTALFFFSMHVCPEDPFLQRLEHGQQPGIARSSPPEGMVPLTADASQAAISILAVVLLGDPIPAADRCALYRRAQKLLPALDGDGSWRALEEILVAARRDALAAATAEPVRRAALQLLNSIEQPETVERWLAAAEERGTIPPEMISLLRAAGETTLWCVAEQLRQHPDGQLAAVLPKLIAGQGSNAWQRAIEHAAARPVGQLLALLSIVDRLPIALGRPLVRALCQHDDKAVRRAALGLLLRQGPLDLLARVTLEQLLHGTDPVAADIARRALSNAETTTDE